MKPISRRALVRRVAALGASAGLVSTFLNTHALADELVTPASVDYQSTPSDGQHCSLCKNFIAGASAAANGTCKVVAGPVSPNGYCDAFEPA